MGNRMERPGGGVTRLARPRPGVGPFQNASESAHGKPDGTLQVLAPGRPGSRAFQNVSRAVSRISQRLPGAPRDRAGPSERPPRRTPASPRPLEANPATEILGEQLASVRCELARRSRILTPRP